jgi:hypothetical protein
MEFVITSVGRDFRPIDVLPITPGFGQQRLRQREVQAALFAFDPQVDVNQPLTVQYESTRILSGRWFLPGSKGRGCWSGRGQGSNKQGAQKPRGAEAKKRRSQKAQKPKGAKAKRRKSQKTQSATAPV